MVFDLHFYSPAAYNYVRDAFNKNLPHPSTLRNWYSTVDGTPGFTSRAKEALVFMLVAINSNWKIPVAYFLVNVLNSQEKANLVCTVLSFVHDTGTCVKTLTFDGTAANMSMATNLGAQLSFPDLKPYFKHP